jgi:hypothetical protein
MPAHSLHAQDDVVVAYSTDGDNWSLVSDSDAQVESEMLPVACMAENHRKKENQYRKSEKMDASHGLNIDILTFYTRKNVFLFLYCLANHGLGLTGP